MLTTSCVNITFPEVNSWNQNSINFVLHCVPLGSAVLNKWSDMHVQLETDSPWRRLVLFSAGSKLLEQRGRRSRHASLTWIQLNFLGQQLRASYSPSPISLSLCWCGNYSLNQQQWHRELLGPSFTNKLYPFCSIESSPFCAEWPFLDPIPHWIVMPTTRRQNTTKLNSILSTCIV